ncbi:hypothetical protein RDI58_003789 [Solanum bulbocastanum]|uniref:RRM domain-containing protein n=1 Tax=Solanum bulbocastanum TaxID=147425 RepID=A0AAN8U907_SOLBU
MGEKDLEIEETSPAHGEDEAITQVRKVKKKKKKVKAEKRGVVTQVEYHLVWDHVKLRQVLSQFGEIQRIYLVPEAAAAQMNRKRAGGFRGQAFSEGWVEFTKKSVAKRVANMLNGQQMDKVTYFLGIAFLFFLILFQFKEFYLDFRHSGYLHSFPS